MSFVLYPAIDVRDGRVVRLHQGDYARETRYGEAPLALARHYAAQGAEWLHLVDLDAARAGAYTLRPLLDAIRQCTPLKVQTGGGVRGEEDVEALLAAGADRVVVGSLAVEQPLRVRDWLSRFGADRITVAMDVRRDARGEWRLPSRGWTADTGLVLDGLLRLYADSGLRHVLCTDIERDGMLSGPNIPLYHHLLQGLPGVSLQASGGIRGVADVLLARAAGCSGAVLGKALLDGRFALDEAVAEVAAC